MPSYETMRFDSSGIDSSFLRGSEADPVASAAFAAPSQGQLAPTRLVDVAAARQELVRLYHLGELPTHLLPPDVAALVFEEDGRRTPPRSRSRSSPDAAACTAPAVARGSPGPLSRLPRYP